MQRILKTLLTANSEKKWSVFMQDYWEFFKEQDAKFDAAILLIEAFNSRYNLLPDWGVIYNELNTIGDHDLLKHLTELVQSDLPAFAQDEQFVSIMATIETEMFQNSFRRILRNAENQLGASQKKDSETMFEMLDTVGTKLAQLKQKSLRSGKSTASLIFGDKGRDLEDIYEKNRHAAESGEHRYSSIDISNFENLRLRLGNLLITGAFTSQGKSIWLRYISYIQLVKYGLNVIFFSFEMDYETIRMLFAIMHANNKKIFPNTPKISVEAFSEGRLSDEEYDFLMNVADADFRTNPSYGSLYIDQPNKSRYRLTDLEQKIKEIETTIMPVHAVAADYLTMMWPIASDKSQPSSSDYNQLFKDYKNMALTHRDRSGKIVGFLAMTAAQISRAGFEEAQKSDGVYEMSAFSHYSEIERSADILLSSYAPPDYRDLSKIRLQNLKNRAGAVTTEPVDLCCEYAMGFNILAMETRSTAEVVTALQNLNI